ncbi:UNVERIFIED_CONTAM: hypothetical protein FKN15_027190 [Acipenser sinensis]
MHPIAALEIAGSNPGYVIADRAREFPWGGAQLAKCCPGREGLGQQGISQFTAHQRPLWLIGCLRDCSGAIQICVALRHYRAFFWLLSLLLSSLVWFIAMKASNDKDQQLQRGLLIFGVMFSVLLQEVFRFAYYKLLREDFKPLPATQYSPRQHIHMCTGRAFTLPRSLKSLE